MLLLERTQDSLQQTFLDSAKLLHWLRDLKFYLETTQAGAKKDGIGVITQLFEARTSLDSYARHFMTNEPSHVILKLQSRLSTFSSMYRDACASSSQAAALEAHLVAVADWQSRLVRCIDAARASQGQERQRLLW